jgi:ribosomal protein S12 methylthiotransferase
VAIELPVYSSIAANATIARRQRGMEEKAGAGYFESDAARLRLTPRHYAYLRISEGCNQNCAFCTIPSIRGKMRSKPLEAILGEARELFTDGAFELNLIGQDTTSYGQDIAYDPGLVGMLTALDRVAREYGGAWLRLMYAYPSCFTDEMIDAIASLSNIVKYIDMPLQHIHDDVLTGMKRHTSRRLIETLLEKLRSRVPEMAIRTTLISGFPGETDQAHRELVKFVTDFGFDAMGVFPYSPEPGTPAATRHEQGEAIAPQVVQERIDELMTAQQQVVFARHERMAERNAACEVLIDAQAQTHGKATTGVTQGGRLYVGRSRGQAPDIDGLTYVMSGQALSPGEVVACRVTGWDGYDLVAQPAEQSQRGTSLKILS